MNEPVKAPMDAHGDAPPPGIAHRHSGTAARVMAIAAIVAAAVAIWLVLRPAKQAAALPALQVQVTQALPRAVPVILQSVGKVVAQASVDIRPQTGGVIKQVLIQDGQHVQAGQPLFVLDAQPLQVSLAQARAQWVRDQALARDAAAAEARLKPLADKEYVTAREYEAAVSNRQSLQAAADATKTAIDQARIALGYATVRSPITGRAGAILVKPGSLVTADNATPLVVVNAINPVEIAFSLPQAQTDRLRAAMLADTRRTGLTVEARDSLTQALRATGQLVFIDNAFDESSGTLTLKARFANADESLVPGAFYAVRITLRTDPSALTVAERAVQQGQNGPFVYALEGGKAVTRPITVDRAVDGLAVVSAGLRAGQTIVATVPSTLRNGTDVVAAPAAGSASSGAGAGTSEHPQ